MIAVSSEKPTMMPTCSVTNHIVFHTARQNLSSRQELGSRKLSQSVSRDEISEPHIGAVGQQNIVPARRGVGDVQDDRKEGKKAEQDQVRRKKHPGEFVIPKRR
jgi:hypothetical protein